MKRLTIKTEDMDAMMVLVDKLRSHIGEEIKFIEVTSDEESE